MTDAVLILEDGRTFATSKGFAHKRQDILESAANIYRRAARATGLLDRIEATPVFQGCSVQVFTEVDPCQGRELHVRGEGAHAAHLPPVRGRRRVDARQGRCSGSSHPRALGAGALPRPLRPRRAGRAGVRQGAGIGEGGQHP